VTKAPSTTTSAAIIERCCEDGLILMRASTGANVIRPLMPLVVTDEQLEKGLAILEGAIAETS